MAMERKTAACCRRESRGVFESWSLGERLLRAPESVWRSFSRLHRFPVSRNTTRVSLFSVRQWLGYSLCSSYYKRPYLPILTSPSLPPFPPFPPLPPSSPGCPFATAFYLSNGHKSTRARSLKIRLA